MWESATLWFGSDFALDYSKGTAITSHDCAYHKSEEMNVKAYNLRVRLHAPTHHIAYSR